MLFRDRQGLAETVNRRPALRSTLPSLRAVALVNRLPHSPPRFERARARDRLVEAGRRPARRGVRFRGVLRTCERQHRRTPCCSDEIEPCRREHDEQPEHPADPVVQRSGPRERSRDSPVDPGW